MMSVADILKAIRDDKSLCMFNTIALPQDYDSDLLITNIKFSRKQFYARMTKLMETGLIRRISGRYHLTSLGQIVYHAQNLIGNGVKDYWKLKALDSLHVSNGTIPAEEHNKIVESIIDNQKIKEMVLLR
jgi:hypothetical protein